MILTQKLTGGPGPLHYNIVNNIELLKHYIYALFVINIYYLLLFLSDDDNLQACNVGICKFQMSGRQHAWKVGNTAQERGSP